MALLDWKIVKAIGRGGQGRTSQVVHVETRQQGVLKQLHASTGARRAKAQARMLREVTNLRIILDQGGRVPEVLDDNAAELGSHDRSFFVMSLIQGCRLDAYVAKKGPLPLEDAAQIIESLAQTLAVAHENGIAHRDIKPQNIMIEQGTSSHVVLLDFGLSFTEGNTNETEIGEQVGNRFLALPEGQVYGLDHRDPRCDVTQLVGILLYLLNGGIEPRTLQDQNGRLPHHRPGAVLGMQADDSRKTALEALFDRGFAQRIDERFQSVEELTGRMKHVLNLGSSDEAPDIEELAQQVSKKLVDASPEVQREIALARARKQAESLRDQVAQRLGERTTLADFEVSVDTRISGGHGQLESRLDVTYLTVHIKHEHSGLMYRITYAFQSVDGSEIGVVRCAYHWNDGVRPWSSPIIWFRELTAGVCDDLVKDVNNEVSKGILAIADRIGA